MNRISHPFLYFFVLAGTLFILVSSAGSMLWGNAAPGQLHWTEQLFYGVCHRLPDRTYQIGGAFMAVNTRCFGIFAGLFAGWLFMPVYGRYTAGRRWPLLFLLTAAVFQIVDYVGNLLEIWQNTLHSRALLGALFGFALPVAIADLFINQKQMNKT
ncbi:MAG: DUF2085 domain-containing protein [Balneolaceae bacterium]